MDECYDPTPSTSVTIRLPVWETIHEGKNKNDPNNIIKGERRVVNIDVSLWVFDEIHQKATKTGKLLDLTEEGVLKIEQDYDAGKYPESRFSFGFD